MAHKAFDNGINVIANAHSNTYPEHLHLRTQLEWNLNCHTRGITIMQVSVSILSIYRLMEYFGYFVVILTGIV